MEHAYQITFCLVLPILINKYKCTQEAKFRIYKTLIRLVLCWRRKNQCFRTSSPQEKLRPSENGRRVTNIYSLYGGQKACSGERQTTISKTLKQIAGLSEQHKLRVTRFPEDAQARREKTKTSRGQGPTLYCSAIEEECLFCDNVRSP